MDMSFGDTTSTMGGYKKSGARKGHSRGRNSLLNSYLKFGQGQQQQGGRVTTRRKRVKSKKHHKRSHRRR